MSIWDRNVVYLLLLDRKHKGMKITYGPLPDVLVISLLQGVFRSGISYVLVVRNVNDV